MAWLWRETVVGKHRRLPGSDLLFPLNWAREEGLDAALCQHLQGTHVDLGSMSCSRSASI